MDVIERFLAKVDQEGPVSTHRPDLGPCWLWQANTNPVNGYGYFKIDGTMRSAHRVAWELFVGPIPADNEIDHLCRVRLCVNPAHLEPVTGAENRHRQAAVIEVCRRGGHPLDGIGRRGDGRTYRRCRTCDRESEKRRHRARAVA